MNRIDRLFAITTQLQARRHVRARDLARLFEVSQRTIYRDIVALSESGVPIVSLPGQGYALADGYFLPPLRLSKEEAIALVLGARLLSGSAGSRIANAATKAINKIFAIVDDEARRHLQEIDDVTDLGPMSDSSAQLDLDDERLVMLRRAILERRLITLHYFGRNRGDVTIRQVEPLKLSYSNGAWYLSAFCRMRQGERAFRLDRFEDFQVESTQFRKRALLSHPAPPTTEVVVHFRGVAARWAQERQHWSFVGATETDNGIIATYRPNETAEVAAWLLGWGTAAEVLSPAALRERLRDEAREVAEMLT